MLMKGYGAGIVYVFMLMTALAPVQAQPDAKEVIRKADELARGKTSQAEITIQTIRPTWSRELRMKVWTKGNDFAMLLITAPARDQGTVFLKNDKEVWNWLPSIERVIKLPPSMMTQSWMGTDFTNDDLVKESSVIEDYIHSFAGEEVIAGRNCYKIRMIPKPEAAVVWGMIMTWVDKKDYIQMRAEFYDEDEELVNTMVSYDVKLLGGRLLPSRIEMIPADKKGDKTIMLYTSLRFDQPIDDNYFTTQNMKKVK